MITVFAYTVDGSCLGQTEVESVKVLRTLAKFIFFSRKEKTAVVMIPVPAYEKLIAGVEDEYRYFNIHCKKLSYFNYICKKYYSNPGYGHEKMIYLAAMHMQVSEQFCRVYL